MSTADFAAVVIVIGTVMIVGGLCVVLFMLQRNLRALRATLDELQGETLATVQELSETNQRAARDLDRVDSLLSSAESVSGTVDSASRFAYRTVTNPVVKTLAFGTGAKKAARRLRHPNQSDLTNGDAS